MMNLSLAGIESILSSSKLEVASEDTLYEFVLKWARAQYPKVEERREILASHLIRFLKFPFMTHKKLLKALTCKDLDHEVAKKAVLDALLFKSETAHRQQIMASEESLKEHFIERAYKYKPVEVMEFLHPFSQCIVYLNLKRSECSDLFPTDHVHSQPFYLGGQGFFLSARCNMDQNKSFHCFGLFLGMQEMGSTSFTVDYEFAARMLPSGDFVRKYEGYFTFMGERAVGYRNLFAVPWTRFTADDSPYFIDDTLYLKAELTIKHQSQPQQQPH